MKILDAWVDDPTLKGVIEHPELVVVVDHMPDVTIPPESFEGGWTVGKYGPFVSYSQEGRQPTAGDFNVRFREKFPSIVDVVVMRELEEQRMALPLSRARQLLRKYDSNWRLVVSERDAERGSILWLPVRHVLTCRWWDGSTKSTCEKTPAVNIKIRNVSVPLCREHVKNHNDLHAAKRASSK